MADCPAPLDERQLYRLETANQLLAKLAALGVKTFSHADGCARLAAGQSGRLYYLPAGRGCPRVDMDAVVCRPMRVWPNFPHTKGDQVFLRALRNFVRYGERVKGRILAYTMMTSFDTDLFSRIASRYYSAIAPFRFAGLFTETDQ